MTQTQTTPAEKLTETIKATVAEILKTGNSAQKLYLRIRPNGDVDISEETSWCCSEDEYFGRVPHTLSLEVLKSTRDYSHLSGDEVEYQADFAGECAEEIVNGWAGNIAEWIAAGNLTGANAAE